MAVRGFPWWPAASIRSLIFYIAALGAAFMAIELTLLRLMLGYPAFTLVLLLFTTPS